MKILAIISLFFLSTSLLAQITVDDTLTPTQLIEDIFINSECHGK